MRTAAAATTASDPSPPATPSTSAPPATASSTSAARLSSRLRMITSMPRSRARSARPARVALPPPDLGLTKNTGRRGRSAACQLGRHPKRRSRSEPARLFGGWLVTEHKDVHERGNRRGERDREDNCQSTEQHSHDCDGQERDEESGGACNCPMPSESQRRSCRMPSGARGAGASPARSSLRDSSVQATRRRR